MVPEAALVWGWSHEDAVSVHYLVPILLRALDWQTRAPLVA